MILVHWEYSYNILNLTQTVVRRDYFSSSRPKKFFWKYLYYKFVQYKIRRGLSWIKLILQNSYMFGDIYHQQILPINDAGTYFFLLPVRMSQKIDSCALDSFGDLCCHLQEKETLSEGTRKNGKAITTRLPFLQSYTDISPIQFLISKEKKMYKHKRRVDVLLLKKF